MILSFDINKAKLKIKMEGPFLRGWVSSWYYTQNRSEKDCPFVSSVWDLPTCASCGVKVARMGCWQCKKFWGQKSLQLAYLEGSTGNQLFQIKRYLLVILFGCFISEFMCKMSRCKENAKLFCSIPRKKKKKKKNCYLQQRTLTA